jgi:RNase H-fold protein (predicted Holliday junction resolvase)
MSGSTNYLSSLFGGSFGATDPLLSALYGNGSASTQNPVVALQTAEKNEAQGVKATSVRPDVQLAIKQFTQAVNSAKSVTQLLSNPAVMKVLLTANGMQDQLAYTALATKALTSDLTKSNSLANQLTDTRWKTMAATYNFAANGLSSIQNPTAIAAIAAAYAQTTWMTGEDAVAPGLAKALDFKARAASMTSVDQILGDPTIRSVVTTALGIPQQIAFQSITAQENAISTHLDVTKLQDPKFVETFAQRYLIANSGSTSATTTPDITTLSIMGRGLLA